MIGVIVISTYCYYIQYHDIVMPDKGKTASGYLLRSGRHAPSLRQDALPNAHQVAQQLAKTTSPAG